MKIIKIISFILVSSFTSNLFANGYPITAPRYGVWCEHQIMAQSFMPTAMVQFNQTNIVLETQLYTPVLLAIQSQSLLAGQSISTSLNRIAKVSLEQHNIDIANRSNSLKSIQDKDETISEIMRVKKGQGKNKIFNDDGGILSKEYFSQVCTRTKISGAIMGSKARKKELNKISTAIGQAVSKDSKVTSSVSRMKEHQKNRLELFCSEDNKSKGLCSVTSSFQDADIDFNLFYRPTGFREANKEFSSTFVTEYTYNDNELAISRMFIDNIIGMRSFESPSVKEMEELKKAQFVGYYKNLTSSMNLARLSFEIANNKRTALNKTGIRMSKIDHYRYLLSQFGDKNIQIETAGNKDSVQISTYLALALSNQLRLELLLQKERIKLLDAATLAQKKNSASEQIYMENIR